MLISEIYESRQGEGLLTGINSVFVRTSGYNLRCGFCDTPFTSWNPEGEALEIGTILEKTNGFDARHVVITGGEPMLQSGIEDLSRELKREEYHITIETAGTVARDVACDLMSISPKLSNSTPTVARAGPWADRHEKTRHQPQVVQQLIRGFNYQLKFVVREQCDLAEIEEYLAQYSDVDHRRVLLMPEGTEESTLKRRAEWLVPYCEEMEFVFCPRKHIEWYGNRRGT